MATILLIAVHEEFAVKLSRNIGLQRIRQYLRNNGVECDICEIGIDAHEPFLQKALRGEYAVIGLSSTYFFIEQELNGVAPFYEAKKTHQCVFVAGGNSPSQDDGLWLSLGFDAVIRGYGEFPMLELARKLASPSARIPEAFSSICGLSYMHEGRIVRNPARDLTSEDFRQLNFSLELDLAATREAYPTIFPELKNDLYPELARKYGVDTSQMKRTVNLYTSHACPNRCGYCCSTLFLNKTHGTKTALSIDAKSIYRLVLEYVQKRNIDFISFWDDDFCASRSRLEEFCRLVIDGKNRNEIPRNMKFQCQTRVLAFRHRRGTDMDIIQLMHDAGFILVSLGVENFSQRLLRTPVMNKFGYDGATAMEIIRAFSDAGVCPSVNFMICVPEATPQEVLFNIEKLVELQRMFVSTNIGVYIDSYPGAAIYKDNRYPTVKKRIYNPLNKTCFIKERYLSPHDEAVRQALEYYMTKGAKIEIESMQNRLGGGFSVKNDICLMNLLKCRALCKTLPGAESTLEMVSDAIQSRYDKIVKTYLYFNPRLAPSAD